MTTFDVASALAASAPASAPAPSHLVTRHTGAAVRLLLERQLAALAAGTVAVLDFSRIGVLDRSCADECVAKLVLPLTTETPSRDGYVMLRGVNEGHLDAIEAVLETHGLALVVQFPDGGTHLVGAVSPAERTLWEQVMGRAGAAVEELAAAVGLAGDEAHQLLEALVRRRLLRRAADGFAPLGSAA
ncbi:MAG: hypothetical protein RL139_1422 [Gemmatimonadota bacterium]